MGLNDRDYMQDARGGSPLRWLATQSAWVQLACVNVLTFIIWQVAPPRFLFEQLAVSGDGVLRHGRVWTLITAGFSHAELWHLFWNMLFLYWFIGMLEAIYVRRDVWLLYLLGAVGASSAHVAADSLAVTGGMAPALGASGSVMAMMVAAALFFPTRTVHIWGVLPVPLWALAGLYVLLDVSGALGAPTGVAHAGHLGGAAMGLAFKLLDLRPFSRRAGGGVPSYAAGRVRGTLSGLMARARRWLPRRRDRFVPRGDRVPAPESEATLAPPLASRVDEILRKISREGIDSLTAEERRLLEEASQHYRR